MRFFVSVLVLSIFIVSCTGDSHDYLSRAPGGGGIWIKLRVQDNETIPVRLEFELKQKDSPWEKVSTREFEKEFVITNMLLPGFIPGLTRGSTFRINVYEQDKLVGQKEYSLN